ncbi:ankyrin repeat-containing domain protein [Aspergillus leporis]|jgi:ankyrin repeat protein|uniref:Ankyrin repeat-containing domain protein n=1 Tax=Aspergillus leporis TaxID=41062 RepID=A0A5N5WZZ6_9EURO|nr:ankyrin repeat-containing domain protein [Aspergillus leporis]
MQQGSHELVRDLLQDAAKAASCGRALMIQDWEVWRHTRAPKQLSGVHLAVYYGLEDVLRAMIENSRLADTPDSNGETLSWAVRRSNESVVEFLLEKGLDSNTKDIQGRTQLSWAAQKGHEAVVKLLLKNDIDLEIRDVDGRTPLSWAAKEGHVVVADLLVKEGANLSTKDNNGMTPVACAYEGCHISVPNSFFLP